MEQIQKNQMKREAVLAEVIEQLKSQLKLFKENEEYVGEMLSKAAKKAKIQEHIVGKCPICGTGDLVIIHSRKTKKRFIGCTNYFRGLCSTSFPLPQMGTVRPVDGKCRACGWPQVLVRIKSRRPWSLCLNPHCSLKFKRRKQS